MARSPTRGYALPGQLDPTFDEVPAAALSLARLDAGGPVSDWLPERLMRL